MSTTIEKLTKQYLPPHRYDNFGSVLLGLNIRGIKGTNCNLTFDFPVTAIAGFNGAGKSTIAQIALCMYRSLDGDEHNRRKYLKDFFVKTLLDKTPYDKDATIEAIYADRLRNEGEQLSIFSDDNTIGKTRTIKVYYSTDRWAGYKHQPQKAVFYYGMSYFIPYQEQNSNLLRDGNANITQSTQFDEKIVSTVKDILSIHYATLQSNNISNDKRTEHVISVNKQSVSYSENHMGCGEGRLLKLVSALENAPIKSLFVIEEPETALHQLAQHKLAQYLLDVCQRKKHQIIFTTHSPEMQKALPSQARKYIQRGEDGCTHIVNSPSIAEIENYLSGGHMRKMIVVTEDDIGAICIKEILRTYCPIVFNNCAFFAMNLGYGEIKKYVAQSQSCGIKIFGVVDENRRAEISQYILAFPENEPPEVNILKDDQTKNSIKQEFSFDCDAFSGDHHSLFDAIASSKNEDVGYVRNRCVKLYVQSKNAEYYRCIVDTMTQWLRECDE